ncbi:hypothetical protein F2Q70_00029647 [Brassica cretica]|uniref:Uncharacterized protein n=1 Tax=Brassica cretica TaxID=69181 RepID=A0A8S9FI82_BRACR|nr:hypothetical protein F2Q70_00029647 [Brassica cretica]
MSRAMTEHLRLRIEPSKDSFTFVNFSKVNSGGLIKDQEDNKLFLTLVDREVFYDHVQVSRDHTTYIRLGDDPGFIAVSHCGYEHEDYEETDEYGVYRHKWGDANTKDGRSLNVSRHDIADILECAERMGSVYLSLPRYNVRQSRQPDPQQLVTKTCLKT